VEGRNGFSAAAKVGQPIVLPPPVTNQEPFDLRFETASSRIFVVGGEKLAFRSAEDGTLRIMADLPERSVSLQDHDSGQVAPCELIASRPVWKGEQLCVRWTLRQRDGQFTARPTLGYFLLQPLDRSGVEIGTAAVCVGSADLPGQPLPTWEFLIPAWPGTAVTARVQGWITNAPVTADGAESCAALLEKQKTDETWQALPIPNIGWQIRHDGATLTLIERYDITTTEPKVWTDLRWDRSQASHKLLSIERRFDAAHHLFVQTWTFDRDLAPADIAGLQCEFTRLDRLRAQGWDTASAMLLPVASEKLAIQPVPVMRR
ncbi:MAG TPA: hypothetical protein VFG20_17605, partial [Planctomycetaceae bacterium]|nr:hypothetical protein [Planctomycetaceae bacterium]